MNMNNIYNNSFKNIVFLFKLVNPEQLKLIYYRTKKLYFCYMY